MKANVAVIFGGNSVEHEISIISALQAYASIDREKYDLFPIYIAKNGVMYSGNGFDNIENYKDIPRLKKQGHTVFLSKETDGVFLRTHSGKKIFRQKKIRIDIAFPIVHGLNAEDGTVQGFLHLLGLPYVGCDVLSSALGMDKYVSKTVLKSHGIPVLDCVLLTAKEYYSNTDVAKSKVESALCYPVIIKPVDLGSSVGISIAHNETELHSSLELAFTFSGRVIIEPAVTEIQEINCSVLGSHAHAEASECEEPLNAGEILSYQDKYMSGGGSKGAKMQGESEGMASLQRRIPANITDEMRDAIRKTAVDAFHVLGAEGVVRIDFIIDKAKNEFYLNEVNTIPGSLSFYLWEPMGLAYKSLLNELLSLAVKRKRNRDEITTSFETNVLSMSNLGGVKK